MAIAQDPETASTPLLDALAHPVPLTFHPGDPTPASSRMEAWIRDLAAESGGKLPGAASETETTPPYPCFVLGGHATARVHYHFIPQGPEESVFREMLARMAEIEAAGLQGEPGPGETQAREELGLLVFVANECPNCPQTLRTLFASCLDLPFVSVHVVEATLSQELARENQVRSVPTLLVGDDLRFVGTVEPEMLEGLLRDADPAAFGRERIRQCMRQGRAEDAGRLIAENPDPSFLADDLERSSFQERVGLLLALEEALEKEPRCLDPLVPRILPCLERSEAAVRGDLADLLGRIGHPAALQSLKALCKDPDPDVAEAARDAVESIAATDGPPDAR